MGSYENDPTNYFFQAISTCMNPASPASAPDGKGVFEKAGIFARHHLIDSVANLKDDRISLR